MIAGRRCLVTVALLAGLGSPAAHGQAAPYTAVLGDDWVRYADTPALLAAVRWFAPDESRFRAAEQVAIVSDPIFGRVARITQPADPDPQTRGGFSPQLRRSLPEPLGKVWFRLRVKFSPGWTTSGSYPPGWANSYKLAFLLWQGYSGRAEIEFSNTRQYITGVGVQGVRCSEIPLPGSQPFGNVTTEWSGGDWWEFVMYYERIDSHTFRQRWWRRQLTASGSRVDNAFTFRGSEMSCPSAPLVRGIALGANKNKAAPVTQYIYWGPWEVVDGSAYPNPFHLPNVN